MRLLVVSVGFLLTLNVRSEGAQDQNFGLYAFVTSNAYQNYNGQNCSAPDCISTFPNGSQAFTSYYTVAQEVYIIGPQEGEVWIWQVIKPDGTNQTVATVTYTGGCYRWSSGYTCGTSPEIFWVGPSLQCPQPTGQWTSQVLDNGAVVVSAYWNLSPGGGPIYITKPTSNQLFDLNQQDYIATGTIPFVATSSNGSSVNWFADLSYNTSQGYGYYTDNRNFGSSSGSEHDETYTSEGGRVKVTAQATADDGSTVQDCATYYVEGTRSFDPTNQLVSLYASGATPRLMTGLAQHESGYYQFTSQNLLGATALWPTESDDGGSHIGLMMIPTAENLAWDWLQNTNDGVNDTNNGFAGAKLPLAKSFVNWLTGTKSNKNVPVHQGLLTFLSPSVQLENMALVLYRGNTAAAGWAGQYYIPVCPPPGTIKAKGNTWTCNGASWYWAVNDPNITDPGADQNVQAQYIFAPGTSGSFGNRQGLQYVTNVPTDPWYDHAQQLGVMNQIHN